MTIPQPDSDRGKSYASICSGIEAASVAWSPLGWKPAFFAEIEKFPSAVLAHHYPRIPNYGDITKFKGWPDADFDVLVGGTPCQSFSVAGLRKGLADPRGNLALVYLAIAERYKPRWIVWENVPGVLSSSNGRDFGSFLGGLVELGYGFAYRVLDAQHCRVDGLGRAVPQRRRRVFVIGHLGDWRRAAAVLFERESLCGNTAPRRETGQSVAGSLGGSSQSGGFRTTDLDNQGAFIPIAFGNTAGPIAFNARQDPIHSDAALPLDTVGHAAVAIQERAVCENPEAGPDGIGVRDDGAAYTLEARTVPQAVAFAQNSRDELVESEVMQSLKAGGGKPGQSYPAIRQGWAVRRLTPKECSRLQGFPDDYLSQVTWRGKSPPPDGPMYKALGNSMAVNCMRWLGTRIAMVDAALQTAMAA